MAAADTPEWIKGRGPDAEIVISTRARLARSLASFPFPARATGEDLSMVSQEVRAACTGLAKRFAGFKAVNIDKLGDTQRSFLLDAHIASVEQIKGGAGRLVILEPTSTLSVMVNEEDHVRLQALVSGLAPEEAWKLVDWADDVLAERLDYGYSERYGYLNSSVTNVGTGLRVSAMMHLAGLAWKRRLGAQLRAAYDLGVSVRGMFGEQSRSAGDLYQVSNEITLGLSEEEIVERVRSVAQYLLVEERATRKELLRAERSRLVDVAARALHVVKNVRAISALDAITAISPLRMGAALGIVGGASSVLFNEALVGMRVGAPQDHAIDAGRASLLRRKFAKVDILSG